MKHPLGRCEDCGERLYEHIDGGYQCLNCDSRYPAEGSETGEPR